MKALRTKVILSAFVLLFALVATIGSTYAWFTVSTTVSVPELGLNVKSGKSLLIRPYYGETGEEDYLDVPANYKTSLTATDIKVVAPGDVAYATYQTSPYATIDTWTMDNLTAIQSLSTPMEADNLNGTSLKSMDVDTKTLSATTQQNLGSAGGQFVDLKFWLFSQVTAEEIVLKNLSITSAGDTHLAVGVSAFVSGADSAKVYSVDPDYGYEFTLGTQGYDGNETDYIDSVDIATLLADHALAFGSADVDYVSTDDISTASAIAELEADTPTLMVVRVYLEGWDAETTNGLLASSLNISFQFALKDTTVSSTIVPQAIAGVTAPVKGATPVTWVEGTEYVATITWNGNPSVFAGETTYTATITVTPKIGYTLSGVTENYFTISGATSATNAAGSGVITAVFPVTAS